MPEKITKWLDALGLGRYARQFSDQEVVFEDLVDLSDDDLKELGIPLGPRKRILKAIATLAQTEPVNTASGQQLATWDRHPDERKPATVLFADITGSTALTEQLDAEDAHHLLDGARQRMCSAIANNRGTVCRVSGDGVMAVFGAPVASEQHAVEACEAALEMQHGIDSYANELEADLGSGLQIRVGLHSGEIVVLTGGEGDNVEYDADGPTVPIAARMEQSAEPGAVYITAATRSLAGDRIATEPLAPISVKGVSRPVAVFTLHRMQPVDGSDQDGASTPFVGRRAELNQFDGILDSCVTEGCGQTVCVRGEPGIGKTRLVREFRTIAESKGVRCHRGLVHPFGVAKGQDAVRALVRSLLGVGTDASHQHRLRTADRAVSERLIDVDLHVHLNDLLDLPQTIELKSLYDAMDSAMRHKGQQAVVAQLVNSASSQHALLIVIEDVHWADALTLAHIAALAKSVSKLPTLLVMTTRIEGDPLDQTLRTGAGPSGFTSMELGPLRKAQSLQIIRGYTTNSSLGEDCLERSGGNPLFLEQLLISAQEGAMDTLPDSIQSLVLARLDRLREPDKRALQCAAVIGQQFDPGLLEHLLDVTSYDCSELIRHNLVSAEGMNYLFTHALIQEGVYGSLLKRHRRALHKRCAEYLADSDSVLCAEHLGHADDPEAAGAFLKAAQEQAGSYRYESALTLTERGLAFGGENDILHRLKCLRGNLLLDLDDVEASITVFEEILEQARDDLQRFDAWMGLAAGKGIRDDYNSALELLEHAEPIAVRHNLSEPLAKLHHLRGNLYYNTGNIDGCRDEHSLALAIARETGSLEDEARALGGVADAECASGRMRSAYESFQLCIDRCRQIGLGRVEVANFSQMANCFFFLGQFPDVVAFSREAVEATVRVGHLRAQMNALVGLCNVGVDTADAALLVKHAERGHDIARSLQSSAWESYYLCLIAVAHYFDGDLAQARKLADKAMRIGEPSRAFMGGWLLGSLSMITDDPNIRSRALREGDELLAQGTNSEGCLHFLRFAMLACWQAGLWKELDRYADAMDDYTRAEPLPWSDFFIARSRLLARIGRRENSDSVAAELNRLVSEARTLGYTASVNHLEAALAQIQP